MKKILIVLFALALVGGFYGMSSAAIDGTAHDFVDGTGANNITGETEICKVCHAPHNPTNAGSGPLWNHAVTTETAFGTYTSPTGTLNATDVGQPGGVSKLCLSCHDGVTAVDSYGGTPTAGNDTITTTANLGTDLSNDHPISFTYDATLVTDDGELATLNGDGTVGTNNLPLFGTGNDQMECASCHDAHGTGNAKFLRVDNANSNLCTSCHSK